MTRPHLAALLGVNALTISRWEAQDGLPAAVPGAPGKSTLYDVPAVVRWYVARAVRAATGNGSSPPAGGSALDLERAKLARIQARRTELDVAQREGDLVAVAAVVPVVEEMLATVRSHQLAIPSTLAEPLTAAAQAGGPRAVEVLLRERITESLRDLAAWRPPAWKASA